MNRTRPSGRKYVTKPPPQAQQSEDDSFEDTDAEELAHAVVPDDTRRKKATPPDRKAARGDAQQKKEQHTEAPPDAIEEVKEPVITTGTSFTFLLAIGRNSVEDPISHPKVSTYIPDSGNMFMTIHYMVQAFGENTRLFEICPDFSSIAFSLYYGYLYYYQILRARDAVGVLTRLERRSLKIFESIGKPESWPIATPLAGFVQALGSCESPDKMYSYVAPSFPDFSKLTAAESLSTIHLVEGVSRAPLIPAQQEMLHRFGRDTLHYNDDTLRFEPTTTPLSDTNQFLGIKRSLATTANFQTLAFNQAWDYPHETSEPIGNYTIGQRQARTRRWNIPTITDTSNLNALENFLFGDGSQVTWIRQLQRISAHVNNFFPGSTNLGAIPPTTTMENFTSVHFRIKSATHHRIPVTDRWVTTRSNWIMTTKAKYFGDTSTPLVVASKSTATNSSFDVSVVPALVALSYQSQHVGPYFVNDAGTDVSVPVTQSEGVDQQDPTVRISEIINSSMYNNRGAE
jgi:hypothetical protein